MPGHPAMRAAVAVSLLSLLLALVAAGVPAPAPAAQTAGVQIHPLWDGVSDARVAAQLDRVAATGAGLVRVDVGWASLEQEGKGQWSRWHLGRLDRLVGAVRARRLQLLLTVFGTPCWASTAPDELRQGCQGDWWDRGVQAYAPRDPRDYADALSFLVRRYGPGIDWEIWNEPNHSEFFIAPDRPAAYAALLRKAHDAIKAADPGATVVGGSLSRADAGFTEVVYQHGVQGTFDVWSVHPYAGGRSPLDPGGGTELPSYAQGVPAVREVMLRHGDDKPLWLTEVGWNTSAVRGGSDWANGVDERTQADYLDLAFRLARLWSYVDAVVWYALEDRSADRDVPQANYGLLRADGRPKPAFDVFSFVATAMRREAGGVPPGGG
jgi:polysaccharide biosynthesis protein PslG